MPEEPGEQAGVNSQAAPNPLEVLITGMSQLQQVLIRQKGGETLDLEPKAVSELAKLPEYTRSLEQRISRTTCTWRSSKWEVWLLGQASGGRRR